MKPEHGLYLVLLVAVGFIIWGLALLVRGQG